VLIMSAIAAVFSTIFAFVVLVIPLVNAAPFAFLSGAWTQTGLFLGCIAITIPAINLVVAPMLALFAGRGLLCFPQYRLMSNTWTTLQAKGGTFWLWIEFLIQVIILGWYLYVTLGDESGAHASSGKTFALNIVKFFNSNKDELNFFRDYAAEANANIALAAFVEALIGTWALYMVQLYVVAPRKKSQQAMDDAARLQNPAGMPFHISDSMRILAFLIWWSSLLQGVAIWAVIYFVVQNFVSRSNMMGRVEPGPPAKALQYRICFHVYLPFHVLIRLLLSIQTYAAVPTPRPYAKPFGDGDEWLSAWRQSGPQGVHFFCNMLLLGVLLIAMPVYAHRRALSLGVLTPWAMLKMAFFVGDGLDDEGFASSARVSVGVHHATSGIHFGVADGRDSEEVKLVRANLREGALYQPPGGTDLLSRV